MSVWKSFQDLEPVVLKKSSSINVNSNNKSKSNIHIKNNTDDDNELPTIIKYSHEQLSIIRDARIAKGLTQQQLTKLINPTLNTNFITNIENGKSNYDKKTYNTILRTLNIKNS
jgi:ribosome-binding protein aMBF1 (putative translation factor)